MKISYNWLKDYIPIELPVENIVEILTNTGLEVAGTEKFQSVKGGLEGLLIGKVICCKKHPNADRLFVTKVDIGNNTVLPIVCGAPNVAAEQKVVVATVGTQLHEGEETFTIKKTKIRGEISEGMICAEDEIGLGDDHSGIIVLPEKARVGTWAKNFFKIENDTIIEIDLTPNRIDGASHIGVARDIAAYLQQNQKITCKKPDISAFSIDEGTDNMQVIVENTEACPRYSGLCIKNINPAPSPGWLQNRLKAIGLKPINNIVDITNYVLFETGQPLHAFDREKIKEDKVIVKTMPAGTAFTTLDEIERKLHEEDLMICDADSPMCIGGVFGGINSGISENTTSIFLESAYFNPVYIRKSARRHGLATDASYRFERGVDPEGTIYALKRAALLMKEICGAAVSSDIFDIYPKKFEPFRIDLKFKNLYRLTGKKIPAAQVEKILKALDILIIHRDEEKFHLEIPLYRVDVTREADVIEEILRIYGYNNVEVKKEVYSSLSYFPKPDEYQLINLISDYLSGNGFAEIMNNSLTQAEYCETQPAFDAKRTVKIFNPLSADHNVLRQSLVFGGLETINYNRNRQNANLKLYEFGNVYFITTEKKYDESQQIALFLTGRSTPQHWKKKEPETDFYELKAFVENILKRIGIQRAELTLKSSFSKIFQDGLQIFFNKLKLAELGNLRENLIEQADIDAPVFYAEMYWENMLQSIKNKNILFNPLPKFPSVRRDLALLLDKPIPYQKIEQLAFKTLPYILQSVNLFDVYEGDKIEAGKKSYAVSFILQDITQTLTDKRIDKIMQKLIVVFMKELGAVIR